MGFNPYFFFILPDAHFGVRQFKFEDTAEYVEKVDGIILQQNGSLIALTYRSIDEKLGNVDFSREEKEED